MKVLSKALPKFSKARTDRRTFNSSCFSSSCCRVRIPSNNRHPHHPDGVIIPRPVQVQPPSQQLTTASKLQAPPKTQDVVSTSSATAATFFPILKFRTAFRSAAGRWADANGERGGGRGISRACNTSLFFFPFFLFFVRPPDRACSLEDGEKGEGGGGFWRRPYNSPPYKPPREREV